MGMDVHGQRGQCEGVSKEWLQVDEVNFEVKGKIRGLNVLEWKHE
jgi:hypothetical protein